MFSNNNHLNITKIKLFFLNSLRGKKKLLTIAVPIYNSPTLDNAISSILNQTFTDFNLLLFDDGSNIETKFLLKKYSNNPNIVIYTNSENSGLISAWNKAADISYSLFNTEYFMWASDHDILPNDFLEGCINEIQKSHEIALVGGTNQNHSDLLSTDRSIYNQILNHTLNSYDAGELIYGVFRFNLIKELKFLPYELFPDRILISKISTKGNIVRVNKKRIVFNKTTGKEDILLRQRENLFGKSRLKNYSLLSHALYLIKNMHTSYNSYSFVNAYLFFLRAYQKWGDDPRFLEHASEEDIMTFNLLKISIGEHKYHELKNRIRELKIKNKDLVEKVSKLVERRNELLSLKIKNKDLVEKVTELIERRNELLSRYKNK